MNQQNKQQTRGRKCSTSKSTARRTIAKAILMLGGGALAMLSLAAPVVAQQTAATQPAAAQAHNAPTARAHLITDGLSSDGKVVLVANKTTVVTTARPYKSVSVGQPEVADVTPVSPTNILVTAKKPGSTQLVVWDDNNRTQVADVNVTMDLDALANQLNAMFPGTKIEVSSLGGAIALRGRVPDIQTAEQAASAAGAYGVKVLNFLEVGGGQQVMLQVRFAEVSRSATSQLGVNFAMTDGIFSLGNNVGQVTPSGFAEGGPGSLANQSVGSGVTIFGSGQAGSVAFRYFISALRQNNLLRVLAEPNLIAMSGQEASFLAGGEFPVPVPQSGTGGAATITIEYREFGVRLGFVPIVLGDGRIRLKMTPEVSDLDFSSPIVISGSRIPIVNKRKVTTMVELGDGQSFAIAGLLNNTVNAAKDVTPVLGDLPVLGSLFRSVRYQRKETELVVLVTPKLVAPLNPGQTHKVPGEHWRHPNEANLFLNQDIGGEMDVPVERMPDTDPATPAADESVNPTTAPTRTLVANGNNSTTQPAIASSPSTQPAMTSSPSTQPAFANNATTRPAFTGAGATTYPALAVASTTQPGFAAPSATKPPVIASNAATTKPAISVGPATQPAPAMAMTPTNAAPSTRPSVTINPSTQPAFTTVASNPTATTRPAVVITPSTQPSFANAASTTRPAMTMTPTATTQPAMTTAMTPTATTPPAWVTTNPPSTQPAVVTAAPAATQPSMAMATPLPPYGAKPGATGSTFTNTTQPTNTTVAMANNNGTTSPKTASNTNGGGSTPASAGNLRFTPRYHGRHGFTPPSHAPPRGQQ